jgi:hypothetical protein
VLEVYIIVKLFLDAGQAWPMEYLQILIKVGKEVCFHSWGRVRPQMRMAKYKLAGDNSSSIISSYVSSPNTSSLSSSSDLSSHLSYSFHSIMNRHMFVYNFAEINESS